jgi:hypothetical protein
MMIPEFDHCRSEGAGAGATSSIVIREAISWLTLFGA